jgi:hypothetical protein
MDVKNRLKTEKSPKILSIVLSCLAIASVIAVLPVINTPVYAQNLPKETQKALPADKYNPRGPEVSEQNFKETLKKEGLVWVMYDHTAKSITSKCRDDAERFWTLLKKEFGSQVDAFIRINIDYWSNYGQIAHQETTKNKYPSFHLYDNGIVVRLEKKNGIRIRGCPDEEESVRALEFIRQNSMLK